VKETVVRRTSRTSACAANMAEVVIALFPLPRGERGGAPAAIASLTAAFALAACATTETTSSAHPDFSGYWDMARPFPEPDAELMALVPAGTVELKDTGAAEFPRGEYGGLILTPYALQVAEEWEPTDDFTLSRACSPPSIAYSMQGPFPFEISQSDDFIVIRMEYFDVVRIIYTDGRGHPPEDAPHTKAGHSIGHWEGDILVVDTTHLEASTLTNNGLYHSDQIHLTERFKLSEDGQTLVATQELEDPVTLENRGFRFIAWTKGENYVYPYECDPTFALNYGAQGQ
jgi:hypothetical protein